MADLAAHFVAVDTRQHDVKQNEIRLKFRYGLQRFVSVAGRAAQEAFFRQVERDQPGDVAVVIHNQYFLL